MTDVVWVFGTTARPGRTSGPLHAEHNQGQAWCGVKMQFRHWRRHGSLDQVTCPRCIVALRKGQPRAWKS